MKKSINSISDPATLRQHTLHLVLVILLLPLLLMGSGVLEKSEYHTQQEGEFVAYKSVTLLEDDPALSLLGKSFEEITQLLGEPDEKGFSEMFGPHQYILYSYDEGFIRFCSPESLDNEIAVSIILGPGQEVLGTTIGMRFTEIIDILGTPDYGPDIGIDNLYYLDYYYGENNDIMPEIFISFVGVSMDSPTDYIFIKLENSNLEGKLL